VKIIIFSVFVVFVVFVTSVLFFLKMDKIKENHISNQYYMDNKKLRKVINTLFIDSPEDDLFLYSRLITSMDENGIQSLGEYDFNLLKKNVETVLESYLNSMDLFPKSYFNHIYQLHRDEWTNFIRASLVYIEYLNSIGKENKANKLLEKTLYYTQQRVLNSKIMINYTQAIYNYDTLCRHIKSNEINKLLKKYPLADKSIFFQKLVNEKEYQFYLYTIRFNSIIKEKYNQNTRINYSKEISNYRTQYFDNVKQYLAYYEKLAIVIKSESPQRIKKFYDEIEKEKNDFSEKSKKMLKIDYEKYMFLIGFSESYPHIYNLHKKLINIVE
jgi:hypothetical protein